MSTPDIKPIKVQGFEVKQSPYSQCEKLPMRAMICAPSGGGKTILLQNMILDIYALFLTKLLSIMMKNDK